MLDSTSLEVISRFKQALLDQETSNESTTEELVRLNRGFKLQLPSSSLDTLNTKVVEYNGINHLVLTNDSIEKSNLRNKRKWKDVEEEEEELSDSDDEHPFKRINLADVLAPLNHPLEIISHPAILNTYKLQIFYKLLNELIELIEVEQQNLNWLNKLLQVLNGEDWFYLLEENLGLKKYDHGLDDERIARETAEVKLAEIEPAEAVAKPGEITEGPNTEGTKPEEAEEDPFFALPDTLKRYESYHLQFDSNDELTNLKDDLINYLQVSIQRQHEYIKNLSSIRNGIVRADRLKRDLYKWGKEIHDKKS